MKKTCFNCSYFHPTLTSPEEDSFFHIHNYCDAWGKSFDVFNGYSRLCQFIDENIMDEDTGKYKVPCIGFFDDFEIGKAGCYRFDSADDECIKTNDNWMRENFEKDKELALKLVDYMIEHPEIPEDVEYYKAWKEEIKNMRFEDNLSESVTVVAFTVGYSTGYYIEGSDYFDGVSFGTDGHVTLYHGDSSSHGDPDRYLNGVVISSLPPKN